MKNSIKRAQSQARLSFAERENFRPKVRQIKKTILTLVALLAVTTGAWAESKPIGLNVEYEVGDEITSTTDVYVYYGEQSGTLKKMGVKITSTQPLTISMIFDDSFGFNGDDAVYYLPDGVATGGSAGAIPCVGESTGDATVVHVASGSGTLADPYVFGSGPSGTPVPLTRGTGDKIKEWTFTMPGGNVTLEPEYYPQAALTAAPTAINDVPATTDGAIVKAGTVKNIGETTTAQGTVMYYVSTTALDDAALLALAADKWKADVPTAQSLSEGKAYVYYYVRGNDSDNDEENFSDGDILSANALTVTIAAEPTYAVTFAEGVNPEPPAEPEWTASPATDVKKGTAVTVTYTGPRKVMGVKAEKKAAEKTITIGTQNYTVQKGETWKQFITRNQLSGWTVAQYTDTTWYVYKDKTSYKLRVKSDGTNWTQLVLSSQDAPIDTDKQYKWVQEEISSGGSVVVGEPLF